MSVDTFGVTYGVERGCGERVEGGVYLCVPTSDHGMPLEYFTFCPPLHVPSEIKVAARGQTIVQTPQGYAVLDHIGGDYPNVADYWEETRRFGVSRRIAPNVALSLPPGSLFMPIHPRAFILNWELYPGRLYGVCPRHPNKKHPLNKGFTDREAGWFAEKYPDYDGIAPKYPQEGCSGYWWEDVVGGEPVEDEYRRVKRTVGSTTYFAYARPEGLAEAYCPGIIFALPISHFEVVGYGDEAKRNLDLLKDAQYAAINVPA